jgi:hypothetical protein
MRLAVSQSQQETPEQRIIVKIADAVKYPQATAESLDARPSPLVINFQALRLGLPPDRPPGGHNAA